MLAIFPFPASDGQPEQVKRKTPRGSEFLAELLPCEGSYQPLSRLESEMNDSRPSDTGPAPDARVSPVLAMPAPPSSVGAGVSFLEDAQSMAFSEGVYTQLGDSQPGLALRAMLESAAVDALAQRLMTEPAPADWTTYFRDAHDLLAAWANRELDDEDSPLSNARAVLDVEEMAGLSVVGGAVLHQVAARAGVAGTPQARALHAAVIDLDRSSSVPSNVRVLDPLEHRRREAALRHSRERHPAVREPAQPMPAAAPSAPPVVCDLGGLS